MTLAEYMAAHGIRGAQAARELGVSRSTVHCWITEKRVPEPHHQRTIRVWSGGAVTPNDWIGEDAA